MDTNLLETKKILSNFNSFMNRIAQVYSNITGMDKYELFGEANVALIKAIKDFDSMRSSSFNTYAKFLIADALNEYIRQNKIIVSIPKYISRANLIINRIKKLVNYNEAVFYALYTGEILPDTEELKHQLILLDNAAKRAKTTIVSLVDRAEFLPSVIDTRYINNEICNDEEIQNKLLLKLIVKQAYQQMSNDEKLITEHIMSGMSLNEISETLPLPYSRVNKIFYSIRSRVLALLKD